MKMAEMIPTRNAYGEALAEIGAKYEHIVVLDDIVWRMSDPDADPGGMKSPPVGNQTVANRVV